MSDDLRERVARRLCGDVENPCKCDAPCKIAKHYATAVIDPIRAEVLEEAADAVNELGDGASANDYATAIRALKDKK